MNMTDEINAVNKKIADINRRLTGTRGEVISVDFLDLTDTPAVYTGEALKANRVNSGENAIEFERFDEASKYLDNFNDASRYWTWRDYVPAGTITETGGYCQLSLGGVAGNWWGAGIEQCPRAIIGTAGFPMEAITKLTYCTTNADTQAGIFISNNPLLGGNSGYTLGRDNTGVVSSAELGVGNVDQTPGAISLPVWLRIRTILNGNGNTTFFHYSTDGSTYIALGSVSNLPHIATGLFSKNWSNNAIDARFDFFSMMQMGGPG